MLESWSPPPTCDQGNQNDLVCVDPVHETLWTGRVDEGVGETEASPGRSVNPQIHRPSGNWQGDPLRQGGCPLVLSGTWRLLFSSSQNSPAHLSLLPAACADPRFPHPRSSWSIMVPSHHLPLAPSVPRGPSSPARPYVSRCSGQPWTSPLQVGCPPLVP